MAINYDKADFKTKILEAFIAAYGKNKKRTFSKEITNFCDVSYGTEVVLEETLASDIIKTSAIKYDNLTYSIDFTEVKTEEDFILCLTVLYGQEQPITKKKVEIGVNVVNFSTAFLDWYKILVGLQENMIHRPDPPTSI